MKKLQTIILATFGMLFLSVPVAIGFSSVASAQDSELCAGSNINLRKNTADYSACNDRNGDGTVDNADNGESSESRLTGLVKTIVSILSIIIGIIAVIFVIIGGFNYVTSGGDSGKVNSAKNTVIYALVGLIIAALAQVIVRFVLGRI